METGGEGSLEILDLVFGTELHSEEAVMGNCESGESFPGQGSPLYEGSEMGMALVSCKN